MDQVGGGGSAFVAETEEIRAAGRTLRQWARVADQAATCGSIAGVGAAPEVEGAVAALRQEWAAPLGRWKQTLTTFGDAVIAMGYGMDEVDRVGGQEWSRLGGSLR